MKKSIPPIQRLSGFVLLAGLLVGGCAAPLQQVTRSPHVLILTDGTRIPCEITDYSGEELFFQAYQAAQGYRYGDRIIITKISKIGVRDQGRFQYFSVSDFLDAYFGEEQAAPHPTGGKLVEPPLPVYDAPQSAQPTGGTTRKTSGQDTLRSSGVGFNINLLTPLTAPAPKPAEVDFDSMAELIISSGAAGLILYRAEQNRARGIETDSSQQRLIDAIRLSTVWQERKEGLRAAHRAGLEGFRELYDTTPHRLRRAFGFRAAENQDPFISFLIFLKNNGSLLKRSQIEKARGLFGETATRAMQDILANFDDWYYIVVLRAAQK